MGSTVDLLASMPHITLLYTRDQAVLKGRNARWFPDRQAIVMHASLHGKRWRSSIAHELGHAVLGHPASCGHDFYDQRVEAEADEFAARLLLDDLDALAHELATACHRGHAAENLGVIRDLVDVRMATLTDEERAYLERTVRELREGLGA